MLCHQLRQDLILGLDLLLQIGDPLLLWTAAASAAASGSSMATSPESRWP